MKQGIQYCPTTGKVMFDKKTAITARNKRWKESRVGLREYQCDDCGYWHLTRGSFYNGKRHKMRYENRHR